MAALATAAATQGVTAAAPHTRDQDEVHARAAEPAAPAAPAAAPTVQAPAAAPAQPSAPRASRDQARRDVPKDRPAAEKAEAFVPPVITSTGIPTTVLRAYKKAKGALAAHDSACGLQVPLLAAIGKVESSHAFNGSVDKHGDTIVPIRGPRLDGAPGVQEISDSDGGRLDGDTKFDRAVGPMQFIPGTWRMYAVDGNGDGIGNPDNIFDAATATGLYLCSGAGDLTRAEDLKAAVLRYNGSTSYYRTVLAWQQAYSGGTSAVADSHDGAAARQAAADKARGDAAARAKERAEARAAERSRAESATPPGRRPAGPAANSPLLPTAPKQPAPQPSAQQPPRTLTPNTAPKTVPEEPEQRDAAPERKPQQPTEPRRSAPGKKPPATDDEHAPAPHGGPSVSDVLPPGLGKPRG